MKFTKTKNRITTTPHNPHLNGDKMTVSNHKNLSETLAQLRAELLTQQLNDLVDDFKEEQRNHAPANRKKWKEDPEMVDFIETTKAKGFKAIRKTMAGAEFAKKSYDKKTGRDKPGNKVVIDYRFHRLYLEAKVLSVFVDRSAWIIKLMLPMGSSQFTEVRVTKSMSSKVTSYDYYYHGKKKAPHKRDEFGHIIG